MAHPTGVVRWLTALVLLLPVVRLRADVLTVGQGEPFPDVQAAVEAAGDGDIVLVKTAASYLPVTIDDKGLTVVPDTGVVATFPHIEVRNLAAGKTVALIDLVIGTTTSYEHPRLMFVDNAGALRVERCDVTSRDTEVAFVDECDDVAFIDCLLRNSQPQFLFFPEPSVSGVKVTGSAVSFSSCIVQGGKGWNAGQIVWTCHGSNPGAPGLDVLDSVVFAAESVFEGGPGGNGFISIDCFPGPHLPPAMGGPGIRLDGTSLLRRRGVTPLGGPGGCTYPGCFPAEYGPTGPALQILDDSVDVLISGEPHGMSLPVPAREEQVIDVEFAGEPGDLATCLVGFLPASLFVLDVRGQVLVAPTDLLIVGSVPPSGTLAVTSAFPRLIGLEGLTGFLQPLFADGQGAMTIGAPVTVVILDSGL